MDTLIGKDTATQQELEAVLKEASEAKISKDDDKRKQIQVKLDKVNLKQVKLWYRNCCSAS